MDVSNLMTNGMISMEIDVNSRQECINKMTETMKNEGYIADAQAYINSVEEREAKGSTGIGFGVAIPHGKSNGVLKPALAFAHFKNPVEWNSFDGKPVSIAFLIGVPDTDSSNEHLKILITLSKMLIHEDFRQKLLNAKSPDDIIRILQAI